MQRFEAPPAVSVIMPMLNARPFLAESIGSILDQSFSDFELLVVDNGSSDGSREYVASLGDKRIRLFRECRRGAASATNVGIANSRGALLAIMDADDVAPLDRLQKQISFLREHPETVLLGGRFSFLVGERLVPVPPPVLEHDAIRASLLKGNAALANGTTMFRAAAAAQVGGHRLSGPAHDFDFFLRMSEVGRVKNLPCVLQYYRLHDGASTAGRNASMREHRMFSLACAKARMSGAAEPEFAQFHLRWLRRNYLMRLVDKARDTSQELYRQAILQRASGDGVGFLLRVAISVLLNPMLAVWRVRRQWKGLRMRWTEATSTASRPV